jgi:PIN domain nuclease of toxin-antitoxin system
MEVVGPLMQDPRLSTVNYAEVLEKLLELGTVADDAASLVRGLELPVKEFTTEHAAFAASLKQRTHQLGRLPALMGLDYFF